MLSNGATVTATATAGTSTPHAGSASQLISATVSKGSPAAVKPKRSAVDAIFGGPLDELL